MNKTKIAATLTLAALIAIGLWISQKPRPVAPPPSAPPKASMPERLPAFTLKDTDGKTRTSSEWDGKLLVVNFWATWCPPCIEEMPDLIEIQERYGPKGVQVVGVAMDDLEHVLHFIDTYGVNFPVILGEDGAIELAQKMGNRISALPYTAVFDQSGKTLYAQPGKVTIESLEKLIKPRL